MDLDVEVRPSRAAFAAYRAGHESGDRKLVAVALGYCRQVESCPVPAVMVFAIEGEPVADADLTANGADMRRVGFGRGSILTRSPGRCQALDREDLAIKFRDMEAMAAIAAGHGLRRPRGAGRP